MAQAFSRILLAYDDSDTSSPALRYACALARTGVPLSVAYAVKESNFVASAATAGFFPPVDPAPMIAAADEENDSVLKGAIGECAGHGVVAKKVFVHGSLADGIVAAARAEHADLIVVGTHGRKGLARTVLGSVAEAILRSSDVPVLVVTRHVKGHEGEAVFQRALVAVDESEPSRAALSVAAHLSSSLRTRLILCTAFEATVLSSGGAARAAQAEVHAAASQLAERGEHAAGAAPLIDDEIVVSGPPEDVIEPTAIRRNCDLIIVGSHARHGLHRVLEGSVAETVARSCALPVLVVPAKSALS
jgi:nucleotide-binding universal stress UspA family protein